jgi:hypothetical protein
LSGLGDAGAGGDGGILGNVVSSLGESSGGGGDPLTAMVMEMTFPVMKPVIEEGVRRATVSVSWKEGDREQTFDVVQYLVNEMPMLPGESAIEAMQGDGGAPSPTTPTSPISPTTGARR